MPTRHAYFIIGPDTKGPGAPSQTGMPGLVDSRFPNIALSTLLYDEWDCVVIALPEGETGNCPQFKGHHVVRLGDIDEKVRLDSWRNAVFSGMLTGEPPDTSITVEDEMEETEGEEDDDV